MEEQRKNSYDPNEDIVDRMWKRSKNSINLVIVVCNILVFLAVTLTGAYDENRCVDKGRMAVCRRYFRAEKRIPVQRKGDDAVGGCVRS